MEKKRLGVQPQNGIPGFILHFPFEPSYGYLRFEGNGKIPLGRLGKGGKSRKKGKGKDKEITKFVVAGSRIRFFKIDISKIKYFNPLCVALTTEPSYNRFSEL